MTRKAGLGRGLGALLPGAEETGTEPGVGLTEISVDEIHPNPRQPRTTFRQEDLDELAASIQEQGVLQPVVVRPRAQGGYELLVGERRLRASKLAGARQVPAIIRHVDDRQALEQALVENVQRADLGPLEEGQAYRNLVDLFELTQEEAARRVGKSRVHITNTLRLLDLPEEIKTLISDGSLQAGHARALLAIKDSTRQIATARRAVERGLTVRQIEELARADGAESPQTEREPRKRRHPDLEESLSDHLGTEVRIDSGRGRGRITIAFGSRDDLHRIVELLLGYE
ncbi:MAG TPA: ParB/RepB/Spo0J family partition protein [Actinomycetota bacterium]|jgi:ParB family chromosome partitioning protein|nr:ParB/RepB/Spo0J family partition protein [Actinomycetota bacterium]